MHTPTSSPISVAKSKEAARGFGRLRALLARPVARGVLVLCGLVVLSLVGRFAVAGGQASPAAAGDPGMPSATSSAPGVTPTAPPVIAAAVVAPVEADAGSPSSSAMAHLARATADDPVYLNEATVDDLRRLPGVGEKRALAILELRRKLGRFRQVEDLLRVKGIGRATLRKLRPLVRVDRPAHTDDAGVS